MTDVLSTIEAAAATAAVFLAAWRPLTSRHDRRRDEHMGDDLFLHGAKSRPGFTGIQPAAVRLEKVEANQDLTNTRLETVTAQLKALQTSVDLVMHEVRPNGGASLRDRVEGIALEQKRLRDDVDGSAA